MRMVMKGLIQSIDFKVIPAEGSTPIPTMLQFFIHLLQNIYFSPNTV